MYFKTAALFDLIQIYFYSAKPQNLKQQDTESAMSTGDTSSLRFVSDELLLLTSEVSSAGYSLVSV